MSILRGQHWSRPKYMRIWPMEVIDSDCTSSIHGVDRLVTQLLLPHPPGAVKPENSLLRESVLGILAGAFVGFGFSTCMIAAGQVSFFQGD